MCKRFIVLLAVFGLLFWIGSSSFAQTTCDDAIEIDGNDVFEGSTLGGPAATEDNEFNCGPWDSPGAWYTLLGNGGETIVTTCSGNLSTYDTSLSVFAGECDDLRCIGANDDNCASFRTDSTVSWVSEVDEIYYILVHGWATEQGNFTLTSSQLEPGVVTISPNGFIQTKGWNMLFPVLNPAGCGGGGPGVMSENWVAPYDLAEEDPMAGDEWDIDFGLSPGSGFNNGGLSDGPIWITTDFVLDNLGLGLAGGDLVDFQQMCVELTNGNFGGALPNDNVMAISTTYVENTTDEPMRVYVCSASDDSVRVDVNNYTVTLVSACRGSAVQCQETRCADLAPGINKITAYVWEGGGGWRMAIGLQDETGQPLTDASEGIIFHGTGEDGELEGQFIDDPPVDCVEAGPPPPPDDEGYENVGPNGFATQSAEGWGGNPQRGIDGDTNGQYSGNSITHTNGSPSWWEVDLQDTYYISYMRIWNRLDCCSERLTNFTITVLDFEREIVWEETFLPNFGQIVGSFLPIEDVESEGQFVRVEMPGQYLSIAELEIFQPTGPPPPPDEVCDNGIDDAEDGDTDCAAADCSDEESCQEPAGPTFVRGDGNSDGSVNLTDGIIPLLYLFSGGDAPACVDAADTNDTGAIEITDAIIIFSWLFSGGAAPVSPSPSAAGYQPADCGVDATEDDADCLSVSPVCE